MPIDKPMNQTSKSEVERGTAKRPWTEGPITFRKGGNLPVEGREGESYAPHIVRVYKDEHGRRCTAFICFLNSTTEPNEAWGILFAAAPELFEALEEILKYGSTETRAAAEMRARAALAKALPLSSPSKADGPTK